MSSLLDSIKKPNDIKKIAPEDLDSLAQEIRAFLVRSVSETGGHLASNLGAVELTMALHLALTLPRDKIIWDVGHQSYTHKLLTGRKEEFGTLRQFGGMSGFPKRRESSCDAFDTGHSSTSVSAALGMVKARDLKGEKSTIVAVIGDGALTGGMAYEALNNASKLNTNLIIILNDNNMSISENVGGLSNYLNDIRTSDSYLHLRDKVYYTMSDNMPRMVTGIRRAKNSLKQLMIPGMYFEDIGITYLGPVDGHNIKNMVRAINDAKRARKAVIVHVITRKGNGYGPAERHPSRFHGTSPFDIETGLPKTKKVKADWTDVFSTVMVKLGMRNENVVAITAAMTDGVGLKRFRHDYPERFFDVGIAEQHAVTFAAGLATGGLIPVVCIYSSFLQRAYDQIVHDVCLQGLHVVFAVDRAGLVGADGETHHGILDLSYLATVPGLEILAPKNKWELSDMMKYAVAADGPVAVRYPRGTACDRFEGFRAPVETGRAEILRRAKNTKTCGILVLAVGSMVAEADDVCAALEEKGIPCTLVNARFVKPFDSDLILQLAKEHALVVTMEENVYTGGFGERVAAFIEESGAAVPVLPVAVPDGFVPQGTVPQLFKALGMDAESVTRRILDCLANAGSGENSPEKSPEEAQ